MIFFRFRKLLTLSSLIVSFTVAAQENPASVKSKSRWGNYFSADAAWDSPSNLNRVLQNNGLPEMPSFQAGASFGWLYQVNRFETGLDATIYGRKTEKDDVDLQRRAYFLSLNFKYLFGDRMRFYPLAGIGFAAAASRITPQNSVTDINVALTTGRNTTTLHSRQGFAQAGFGFRFNEDSLGNSFGGIEVGYRLGFSATPWSTRETGRNMTNSVTDELRQFYVRLVFVGFKRKR